MPHTYSSCLIHCVFSTKGRRKFISTDLQSRLWPYLGGIAARNAMKALAVGGTDDHVHMLLSLPTSLSVAKAVQLIKGGSSKWVHDTFPQHGTFAWQEGYGAFSVAVSGVEETVRYIESQEEHHRTTTFEQEFLSFLRRHGLEYDERFVWGWRPAVPRGLQVNRVRTIPSDESLGYYHVPLRGNLSPRRGCEDRRCSALHRWWTLCRCTAEVSACPRPTRFSSSVTWTGSLGCSLTTWCSFC